MSTMLSKNNDLYGNYRNQSFYFLLRIIPGLSDPVSLAPLSS